VNGGVAEPVTRARRLAGPAPDRLVKCPDLRDVRLIPPPFHGPPPDPRRVGHGEDTLQLEQRSADRHVLDEAVPDDLLEAARLILAAHDVDQHVRPIAADVQQRPGIVDRPDRQDVSRARAAMLAKLSLEGGLQRMAIGVVRSQKVPFLAEFFDQRIGDRVGFHRRRLADPEDIPAAMTAGDFVYVRSGHDVKLALLGGNARHRERDRRIQVTQDEIDVIAVDQLPGFSDARRDIVYGILDQQLQPAAKNASTLIDLFDRQPGAVHFGFGELCIDAAEGFDHPHLHRCFRAGMHQERRGDPERTPCQAGLDEGPAICRPRR
jgi:hypothetical protein